MSFSRLGIIVSLLAAVVLTTNCSYYDRIMSRKNLVDGSTAYKARQFAVAEELFRKAAARDPDGNTLEGRTAQLFLARTLHSRYIGDRKEKGFAEEAIKEYRKAIPAVVREFGEARSAYSADPANASEQRRYLSAFSAINSTSSAISSLLENLQQSDQARQWQTEVAENPEFPETARVRALVALGLRYNTCANEITDTPATKKTVKKDGKDAFQFVKPEKPEDLARLKECVAEGDKYFSKAFEIENETVKTAGTVDLKSLSDDQLSILEESVLPFESARSYRASIGIQAARLAEMEASPDLAAVQAEADRRRTQSDELKAVSQKIKAEKELRIVAAQEAANAAIAVPGAQTPSN
jgi:tetratricopeptide (TPR) repeat protein